jgi:hypothetical protein
MLVKETLKQEIKSIFDDATYNAVLSMLVLMKQVSVSTNESGQVIGATAPLDSEIAKAFQTVFVTKVTDRLTNLIDSYIKSGTVTVQPGQTVATAGSATAQTGATTTPGTGKIN